MVENHDYGYCGQQLGFSGAINFLASRAMERYPYELLMRCEDDFYFQHPEWDKAYLAAIPDDKIAMIWCNYVLKGKGAEPHTAAITGKWFKTLGWMSLPGVLHYFCDNALQDLANEIGRAYYIEKPYIDHRHNRNDPRKSDDRSVTITNNIWEHDSPIYRGWKQHQMKNDAYLLKGYMR